MIILSESDENRIVESIYNDYLKASTSNVLGLTEKILEEIDQIINKNSLSEDLILNLNKTKSYLQQTN